MYSDLCLTYSLHMNSRLQNTQNTFQPNFQSKK